jgi:hypothetical protein
MIRKALTLASIAVLVALTTGCPPPGYASCQTNDDCPERPDAGGKLMCYNLRCVECHYDDNCPAGSVCGTKNTCEALSHPEKEEPPPPPAKSLEECAKRCKGEPNCGAACRDQFK